MLPDKKTVMLHLLEDAWVYVHLDPRREGVQLPDHLRQEKHVILQYGYNMPVPIADFVVDDRGISALLSFRRVPHQTFLPWSAVFAMTDGDQRSMVWPEDLPADLSVEPTDAAAQLAPPAASPPKTEKPAKKPRPSHLKLVD